MQVLVVDDELSMREYLEMLLSRVGYQVSVAGNEKSGALSPTCNAVTALELSERKRPVSSPAAIRRLVHLVVMASPFLSRPSLHRPLSHHS